MALKKTVSITTNLNTEAIFTDAYIRVDNVKVEKNFGQALVQTHKEKNGTVVSQMNYSFEYTLDGPNPIEQAYNHLKSLDKFTDAQDC